MCSENVSSFRAKSCKPLPSKGNMPAVLCLPLFTAGHGWSEALASTSRSWYREGTCCTSTHRAPHELFFSVYFWQLMSNGDAPTEESFNDSLLVIAPPLPLRNTVNNRTLSNEDRLSGHAEQISRKHCRRSRYL